MCVTETNLACTENPAAFTEGLDGKGVRRRLAEAERTAALGPEDGDDGVGEAPPREPRGGGEPLRRGSVHLAVRAHHLRRVAPLPATPAARRGSIAAHRLARRSSESDRSKPNPQRLERKAEEGEMERQVSPRRVARRRRGFIRGFTEGIEMADRLRRKGWEKAQKGTRETTL